MKQSKGGRPPSYSEDKAQVILDAVKGGNFLETAAALAGVDVKTVRNWIKYGIREAERWERGEEPNDKFAPMVKFAEDFRAAEADAEATAVSRIQLAGVTDWKAGAWFLERKFPRKWGQRFNVMVDEEIGAFLSALESKLDDDVFLEVLEIVEQQKGGK